MKSRLRESHGRHEHAGTRADRVEPFLGGWEGGAVGWGAVVVVVAGRAQSKEEEEEEPPSVAVFR